MMFDFTDTSLTNFSSMLSNGQANMNAMWIILAISALVFLLSALMMIKGQRRFVKKITQIQNLQQDLRAITAAAIGVGERVLELERRQHRMAERQEQIDIYESANQPYEQAINMVKYGADIKELVDVCGISESEAELIALMHRLDRTA